MPYQAFIQDPMSVEPDFVNEKGNEFRCEIGLTKYAHEKLGKLWIVWYVTGKLIEPTYMLCRESIPQGESRFYESIATRIDAFAFANMK